MFKRSIIVASLLAAAASTALAQPNVTLSDIRSVSRYETSTTSATISYVIGSHTCNIATGSGNGLLWVGNGTPGLAMNMYRIHDGRMIQLGLSRVKLACCAGDQNNALCGTCGPSGSELGPGCLDVYSSGWNAGQSRLGPRSGINPFARTFSGGGGAGDANWGRIQVQRSDVTPANFPGAVFVFEGVYVASDENLANSLNNASWKRTTVASNLTASVGLELAALGQPAIAAWPVLGGPGGTADASVTVSNATVSGEGTYWYAHKARDLGNGTWRYDYAVFNLNSHLSGGSFSVPVPTGVTVSNIGFYAPDYHSGEPYSNTDWTSARTASAVTWNSPQTFVQNPNANALRWGTTYNFWFDANVAPAQVNPSATLGMFRDTSKSVDFAVRAPGVPACDGIDFNNDGSSFDPLDIDSFLSVFSEGPCLPSGANCNDVDFNNDGATFDPCDIDSFLAVYSEGPCTPCGQ
jgi:hypothetical protein